MTESTTTRVYEDIEGLFRIQVPGDWLADSSGELGVRVAFACPEAYQGFQANVNVGVNYLPPLTQDEFLTLSRLQLKQLSRAASLPVDEAADQRPGSHVFEWIRENGVGSYVGCAFPPRNETRPHVLGA